jgi:hypothetical protein
VVLLDFFALLIAVLSEKMIPRRRGLGTQTTVKLEADWLWPIFVDGLDGGTYASAMKSTGKLVRLRREQEDEAAAFQNDSVLNYIFEDVTTGDYPRI